MLFFNLRIVFKIKNFDIHNYGKMMLITYRGDGEIKKVYKSQIALTKRVGCLKEMVGEG